MAIPQDYIAELSRRTDITELVRGYVQLKRSGRMEKGLCPFHNEKTPSFYVYPDTSSFYCFGCGAGGDAITFVKMIQNLDYVESIKFLAARVGMPMPDEDDTQSKIRGRVLAINRESAKFFAQCLNAEEGREARVYLRSRELADGTIRRFGLGFAPDGGGRLRDYLKSLGFEEDEIRTAGICKVNERGGMYDAFRNRVMFPIIDLRGNVIAFGGRLMGDARGPKYLNSPDTPVFKKSRGLFALNIARKSASRRMLLAEGYMDVIALHQAGFDSAVATLGTALTGEQARLISDYADEVVICYDGDEAGQKATSRAINIFENTNLKVRVLGLSGAKDPDEFIKTYGAQRFAQILDGSGNTIEYALANAKRKYELTTPDGRAAYIREGLDILAKQARPAEQDIYAGRIAEETDVSKAAILTQLESVNKQAARRRAKERENRMLNEGTAKSINVPYTAGGAKALGVAYAEQQLVAALLKNPKEYIPLAENNIKPEHMISPEMAEAYTTILQKGEAEREFMDLTTLSGELSEKAVTLLSRVLALNYDLGFTRQDVEMYIERILKTSVNKDELKEMAEDDLLAYMEELKKRKE